MLYPWRVLLFYCCTCCSLNTRVCSHAVCCWSLTRVTKSYLSSLLLTGELGRIRGSHLHHSSRPRPPITTVPGIYMFQPFNGVFSCHPLRNDSCKSSMTKGDPFSNLFCPPIYVPALSVLKYLSFGRSNIYSGVYTTLILLYSFYVYTVHRVFAENLVSCSLFPIIKPIPTHEKLFAVGKSGPNATFYLFFAWVGLVLGWRVRRFHNNVYMFPNPREFGKSLTPWCTGTAVVAVLILLHSGWPRTSSQCMLLVHHGNHY